MATNDVASALRKRAQIAKANRTMFLWIAISSALVGSALVVSWFLGQQLLYGEKVLAEKQTTVSTLDHNIRTIPELREAIRVLDTNEALSTVKISDDDQAVQVILDALPSDANSLALGASFQQRLLTGVDGIAIESLQVDPVAGVESTEDNGDTVDAGSAPIEGDDGEAAVSSYVVTFSFTIAGSTDNLKQVLQNIERSIRLIDITRLTIVSNESSQQLTAVGRAYYEPAKQLELTQKVVPK
jgi:hypothetical protein